jgi:D-cysteine desulfhydrase
VIGHFLATLELRAQLDAPPDAIVVPLGTGSTAAGIALGVAWLRWSTRVVGVRVASRVVANRWRTLRLARKASATIRQAGLEVDAMGRGYGHPTPEGEKARALAAAHDVRLDPTYGAKAFSIVMSSTYPAPRTVFWHTFAWP